jgi:integrase
MKNEYPIQRKSRSANEMRLYSNTQERLYLNYQERKKFMRAANAAPLHIRSFCLTLALTGCRLSEARELSTDSLQVDTGVLSIRSLKKRDKHHVREIHIPESLVSILVEQAAQTPHGKALWCTERGIISRISAYRWVKGVMDNAGIVGARACPKGLRHGFGVQAVVSQVPITTLQKWLGHSSIETTSIYTNVLGAEERQFAKRMWT